ncbi:hypothetical protein [Erwinia rhapontici]|uniref:hypothetical protein n=1 Tax=Erwinia rhapontici TaxID=55212 RepID=UPI003BA391AB
MLNKIVISSVLVLTGCSVSAEKPLPPLKSQVTPQSTTPATPQLKAPIRKSGPNAVFKSTRSPYSIASCFIDYWSPPKSPPGLIMETERIELKDENGVTHKFTREIVDEVATKAAEEDWKTHREDYAFMEKRGFKIEKEKWGYSVRKTKAGSKAVDIFKENDYSVVNYYFPDVSQYPTITRYSIGYGGVSREGVKQKYDPLIDDGIKYCVKESLYKPHSSTEKNSTDQRGDNGAGGGLIDFMVKALAVGL